MSEVRLGPCPCPDLEVTVTALGVDSLQITLDAGGPATVRVGLIDGIFFEQVGAGPFTFTDLTADTQYQVFAESECGSTFTTIARTDACPAATATFSSTTDTLSVTVTGGAPADVVVNGVTKRAGANGNVLVFSGLTPATNYTATVTSECGNDAIFEFATQPCPAVTATFSSTTNTLSVTVTGGAPADVVVNGVTKRADANGGTLTFTGLAPATTYTAAVRSACGNDEIFEFATQPCPAVTATFASTTNTLSVTVTGGAPADVVVGGVTKRADANSDTLVFSGLTPDTNYTATVTSECGNDEIFEFSTQPCPEVTATFASTTDSMTVTVTGGAPAIVTIGDQPRLVSANGETAVFNALLPDTEYSIRVDSTCGNFELFEFSTQACPALVLVQSAQTPDSLTVQVTGGAPASVTLNGDTKRLLTNGATATWTNLKANTQYVARGISDCDGACGNPCAQATLLDAQTPICPVITFTVSAINFEGFTVTVDTGGPVDFVVYDADNKVLDVAENVSASHTFDGFADGQRLRVEASSYCESVSRQFALVPKIPVFCASRPMYKNGFGFVAGDVADPAATVVVRATTSTQDINLYPTAREGATAPVLAPDGTILGYAVNRSDCSWDGCCQAEEYGAV